MHCGVTMIQKVRFFHCWKKCCILFSDHWIGNGGGDDDSHRRRDEESECDGGKSTSNFVSLLLIYWGWFMLAFITTLVMAAYVVSWRNLKEMVDLLYILYAHCIERHLGRPCSSPGPLWTSQHSWFFMTRMQEVTERVAVGIRCTRIASSSSNGLVCGGHC